MADERDFDSAFAELISREYPDGPSEQPMADPPPHVGPVPPQNEPVEIEAQPFDPAYSGPQSGEVEIDWDAADTPYQPEPLPPIRRWSVPTVLGVVLLSYTIVTVVLAVAGVGVPIGMRWAALVSFGAGLVALFSQLPRHRRDDGDNGARL